MSNEPSNDLGGPEHTAAAEFRDFAKFILSLWGALTALSALLFPLANQFVNALELSSEFHPLGRIPPAVVTAAATFVSLTVLFLTYVRRRSTEYKNALVFPAVMRRSIVAAFICIASLVAFVSLSQLVDGPVAGLFYGPDNGPADIRELRIIATDLLLSALYCFVFVFATRTFVVPALFEYFQQGRARGVERPDPEGL